MKMTLRRTVGPPDERGPIATDRPQHFGAIEMSLGKNVPQRHTWIMVRQDPKHSVGTKVRSLRLSAGFTQAALSERSGLYTTHISRIECGIANPTLSALVAIANALNVPPGTLFDEASQEPPLAD